MTESREDGTKENTISRQTCSKDVLYDLLAEPPPFVQPIPGPSRLRTRLAGEPSQTGRSAAGMMLPKHNRDINQRVYSNECVSPP
ncbi:hypothetical protein E4U54_006494 [Claviceps lovelessii]|nr:hypothetical protein E4U54_006494 [Claviceps lovelessii]